MLQLNISESQQKHLNRHYVYFTIIMCTILGVTHLKIFHDLFQFILDKKISHLQRLE